jgi:hypothetical protein
MVKISKFTMENPGILPIEKKDGERGRKAL